MCVCSKKIKYYCLPVVLFLVILALSLAVYADPGPSDKNSLGAMVTLTGGADGRKALDAQKPAVQESSRPLKEKFDKKTSHTVSPDIIRNFQKTIAEKASRSGAAGKKGGITHAQYKNLRSLIDSNSGGTDVRTHFNRNNGTPIFIKTGKNNSRKSARNTGTSLSSAKTQAEKFLTDNRDLLRLSDPTAEMVMKKEWKDDLGSKHFRYQQTHKGIPLWGREVMVHLDANDSVFLFQGRYEPTPEERTEITPEITADEALDAAKKHLRLTHPDVTATETALVIYTASDGKKTLAYQLDISPRFNQRWLYFIDAKNGSLLHRINNIQNELVTGSGFDLHDAPRTFNTWYENGTYYLLDPSLPLDEGPPYSPVPMENFGNTYILDAAQGDSELYPITSSSPDSGWDPAGISAAYHTRRVHDYYRNTFGRNGIDDENMNYMVVLHLLRDYPGAFWNGKFVCLGDGDRRKFSSLATGLDVIAHEIQHGVTQFTANLIYENQSGALNEAYSDIFACMIDRDDWTVGEDVTLQSPYYLRSLVNPALGVSSLPTKMSEYRNLPNTEDGDNGGVHINMGIPARAAYLVAEGLSAEGLGSSIGRDKTEQIFYRALTTYLQASSQFLDARYATIQAAEDLHGAGSPEVGAVQAAWDAVEVYDGNIGTPIDQNPTSTDIVGGQDMMVYLSPAPYEGMYDLYVQTIPSPFTGYDPRLDSRDLNYEFVRKTRPSAVTFSDGSTGLFYVGIDYNLYGVLLDDPDNRDYKQKITDSGDIWSFAMSPDGRYFAYTSTAPNDNNIYVGDLDTEEMTEYPAVPFSDLPPGYDDVINTILYVDSLMFDYTGKTIVFDALNCLSTPDNPCTEDEDSGHRYWSVGFLNLSDGSFDYPFPNQRPDVDIEYPCFAYNNNFVIALDVIDRSVPGSVSTGTWTLNWQNQTEQFVVDPNFNVYGEMFSGAPTFWGDDDYITVQALLGNETLAYRVPIDASWKGDPASAELLNDYEVILPVMHRTGVRNLNAEIQVSASSLDFGTVEPGYVSTREVTLTNTGNQDIDISDIVISGASEFSHNGTNTLLPRDASMNIRVTFSPARAGGTTSATLIITSDADVPQTNISLTGTSAYTAAIQTSASSLDFGTVEPGNVSAREVTLTNIGDRDIDISDIVISGASEFSHNGTNILLPRDASMNIRVTFSPEQAGKTSSATLIITSDAGVSQTNISLTGTSADSNGGSGGCFIGTAVW
ncbi:M4 family metallopeptidase [Desulfonema magnum]|uniref:Peptidase M4 domain-containing protein n=1 Tax=Desulfonema magnum TaxID=45655 RepID=A0A975BVZ0_9BACT|nr:M4 family metallopeptidase [Desulfonema magnum]QTA92761.1 Peptidase M4 domain-containing protein [Desulfonema magnum]